MSCPSGKIAWPTRGAANQSLKGKATRNKPAGRHGQLRPYRCSRCGAWHLTSSSPVERKRAAKRRSRG